MKSKTIAIDGHPFTYMDEVGDPYRFNPMTSEDMEDILETTSRLLEECGIGYFLTFGTLLGAVREKYFIKGDDDVDIIVTDEEKLFACLPYLYDHGLFIDRIYKTELYTFHTEGRKGHIDMYILRPIDKWLYKNWCVSIRGHYTPKRFFEVIKKDGCCIGQNTYPCPQNPENLLEWWYGRTWRIPQSKKATLDVFIRRVYLFPRECWRKAKNRIGRLLGKTMNNK
jgi:hypothetical protein